MRNYGDREPNVDSLSAPRVFRLGREQVFQKATRVMSEISYRGPELFSQTRD
jgi:hypothetical protein